MNNLSRNSGCPDSKVHGANMGPTWGRQDPDGPHVGHMNLAIWVGSLYRSVSVAYNLESAGIESGTLIQYKDVVFSVWEIPLCR